MGTCTICMATMWMNTSSTSIPRIRRNAAADTPAAVTIAVTSTAAAADMKLSPTAIIPTTSSQAICTMCMRDIAITTARLIWQFDAASVVIGATHRVKLLEAPEINGNGSQQDAVG